MSARGKSARPPSHLFLLLLQVVLSSAALARAISAVAAADGEVAPASVSVDHIRVERNGQHELRVSVLDAQGLPVPDPGPQFSVAEDGRRVEGVEVVPYRREHLSSHMTLLVDGRLLRLPASSAVQQMLAGLGESARPPDRFLIRGLGGGSRSLAGSASELRALGERLPELAQDGPDGRMYDALLAAVRDAGRVGSRRGKALLLLTRGAERQSRHGALDVLAAARVHRMPVPIFAILVEDQVSSPEGERLVRLCIESGGAALRVRSLGEIPAAASRLVARAWGGYVLRFRPSRWEPKTPSHTLTVTVKGGGAERWVHREFLTTAVLARPWWRQSAALVGFGTVLLVAGAGFVLARGRRLCRLVIASGPEKGSSFEVFALPLSLGAAAGNDLTFPDAKVSRNHAVLERREGAIDVVDLNSENGTFVNDEPVTRRRLTVGDQISLGGAVELLFAGRGRFRFKKP